MSDNFMVTLQHLRHENDALRAENASLRAALEAVEWESFPTMPYFGGVDVCPWCRAYGAKHEHAPDCQRQVALGIAEEK